MQDFSSRQYPALKTREGRTQILPPLTWQSTTYLIHAGPKYIDWSGPTITPYHAIIQNGTSADWVYTTDASAADWAVVNAGLSAQADWPYAMADWYDSTSATWFAYCLRPDIAGAYTIVYTDGTTTTTIAHATYPCVAGPMCSHGNRMFVTCENANGTLGYSKLFDPSTWTSPDGGIIEVGAHDNIRVLISMRDRLFIGTDRGIYALFGDDEANYQLVTVSNSVSVYSGRTACVGNDSVYFSDGYEVYEYSGSYGIRNITRMGQGTNGGFAEHSIRIYSMGTDGQRVYCANVSLLSGLGDPPPDWYVYDIQKKRWYIERGVYNNGTWAVTSFCPNSDGHLLASSVEFFGTSTIKMIDASAIGDGINQHNLITDPSTLALTAWTPAGGAESTVGGYYTVTGNGTSAQIGGYQQFMTSSGSLEYVFANASVLVTDGTCSKIELVLAVAGDANYIVDTILTPAADTYYPLYGLQQIGAVAGNTSFYVLATYANAGAANGKVVRFSYCVADNTLYSYGYTRVPTAAEYISELTFSATTGYYFQHLNPTTHKTTPVYFDWISPAYQIRPTAKKTLRGIWISADLTDALTMTVATSSDLDSTSFTTVYTMPSVPTKPSVVRVFVPISANPKAEWIRLKINGTGQATIMNITLDWRVVERAR